jgi:nucleoside-diphosphate-sugar epimerase
MSVLIVGSKGYIGNLLFVHLRSKDKKVYGLSRVYNSGEVYLLSEFIGDSESIIWSGGLEFLEGALERLKLTTIINLAGSTRKDLDFETITQLCRSNIEFNAKLAFFAVKLSIQNYIFVSTYSTSINGENYYPQTFYAATKKAAEDTLIYFSQTSQLKTTILTLYDVYGPNHPHKKIVDIILNSLLHGTKLELSPGSQEINLIHIADVLDALELVICEHELITKDNLNFYTLAGNQIYRVKDLPEVFSRIVNKNWVSGQISYNLPVRRNEILRFKPIHPRIPNWEPKITIEEGLKTLVGFNT